MGSIPPPPKTPCAAVLRLVMAAQTGPSCYEQFPSEPGSPASRLPPSRAPRTQTSTPAHARCLFPVKLCLFTGHTYHSSTETQFQVVLVLFCLRWSLIVQTRQPGIHHTAQANLKFTTALLHQPYGSQAHESSQILLVLSSVQYFTPQLLVLILDQFT